MGCQNSSNKNERNTVNEDTDLLNIEKAEPDKIHQNAMDVQITVIPHVFNTNEEEISGVYRVFNNSDISINFGDKFIIERKVDEEWITEPFIESLGFNDIMHGLQSGASAEYPLLLSRILKSKNLASGQYRIYKEVEPVGKKNEKIALTAKFIVE